MWRKANGSISFVWVLFRLLVGGLIVCVDDFVRSLFNGAAVEARRQLGKMIFPCKPYNVTVLLFELLFAISAFLLGERLLCRFNGLNSALPHHRKRKTIRRYFHSSRSHKLIVREFITENIAHEGLKMSVDLCLFSPTPHTPCPVTSHCSGASMNSQLP